jgi:hypothetical protein
VMSDKILYGLIIVYTIFMAFTYIGLFLSMPFGDYSSAGLFAIAQLVATFIFVVALWEVYH